MGRFSLACGIAGLIFLAWIGAMMPGAFLALWLSGAAAITGLVTGAIARRGSPKSFATVGLTISAIVLILLILLVLFLTPVEFVQTAPV